MRFDDLKMPPVAALATVLVLVAAISCDKAPPAHDEAAPTSTTAAPAPPQETPEAEPVDGAPDFAAFQDADWCPRAYEDTVKIVEGMRKTMKLAGKEAGDDEFAPPEQPRYLELCGALPIAMRQCLVVGFAARNRDDCQVALDGLDDDARATYNELMGK